MVLDTSAILAIFLNEEHGPWALDQVQANRGRLLLSTVNYTEMLILGQDRQPRRAKELQFLIQESSVQLIPPDHIQAEIAAAARLRFPLNLGDCFAYALAKVEGCAILTLDADFRKTDIEIIHPGRRRGRGELLS
ncbi:MAG: type II toxin-antitoxin system VapC family toxin [Acidobacteriota bacterium]